MHLLLHIPQTQTMAAVNWMLRALCAFALHLSLPSSASSLLNRPLVAATVGQNVSLPCNLTSCNEVTWFTVRDDSVLPLLTARESRLSGGDTVERHSLGADRVHPVGTQELQQHLRLLRVEEADAGLYFCSGRCGGAIQVGPGVSLLVGGGQPDNQLCFSVTYCLLPPSIVLLLSAIVWSYLCAAKPISCWRRCCSVGGDQRLDVSEEASLQYSSLKLRPLAPPARGLAGGQVTVTYAAVKLPR
ncbi:uncharacterized protein LOC142900052 [Nelusetta ayraudi]|uniref:uncharacterized protein LOC142900052 n=1 Tax=Nelusetta ayraudi TaxID=303726 RepID=UPI003F707352